MAAIEPVYSPREAAEIIGVSEITVLRWLRKRYLKGRKLGRVWRIRESDLQAFIDNPPTTEEGG